VVAVEALIPYGRPVTENAIEFFTELVNCGFPTLSIHYYTMEYFTALLHSQNVQLCQGLVIALQQTLLVTFGISIPGSICRAAGFFCQDVAREVNFNDKDKFNFLTG
jgi:hypothetical protein